jgi:hypothetical protein
MKSGHRPWAVRRHGKPQRERRHRVTRLGRLVRGRRPDWNPLRRASDHCETAVLAVLLIAFLAAAPFIAQASGAMAHAAAHREQLAELASAHQVPAVVLKPAAGSGSYPGAQPEAQVRWTAPDGKEVTGEIPLPPATVAGATVAIWTNQDGQPADSPLQNSQVAGQTDIAEAFGVVVLAATLIVIGLLVRRVLDRHRMAAWDRDWLATGPRWNRQR